MTTNDENIRETEVLLGLRRVDEGRPILARREPEHEYDLDVDRHNELLPPQSVVAEEHAKEFRYFADVLRKAEEGGWLGK
jgi:hypothetical protein